MKSFYKEGSNQHILIHIDNTSAVAAINKMGSMVSVGMDVVVHEIWDWTQSTKNWVIATHIPRIFNIEADNESRVQGERTGWMLSKAVFDDIIKQLEFKPDIDLFASRLNKQIPKFVSFRPDPESITVNAFNMDWMDKKFFMYFDHSFVCHVCCKKYGRTEHLS